ncbi:amidase family protein [Siccirubricoccus deserti]
MSADPALLPATALAGRFAQGRLSPVAALEAVLARIARLNPRLNAIVALDEAGARAAARASEARWRAGVPLSPLDGVPLTVKDNITVAGLPCAWGSPLFRDFVPQRDELPVARARAAGLIVLGKTNVPEFTLQGYTDNAVYGPTRNPWNLALTPVAPPVARSRRWRRASGRWPSGPMAAARSAARPRMRGWSG